MKLYLIGGGYIDKGETKRVDKEVIKQVKNPSLLIFHWTTKGKKKLRKYRKMLIKYFGKLGVKNIEFAEYDDSYNEIKEKMRKANLIFLPGGNTRTLVNTIKKKRVVNLLKKYRGIIFGNSAGAACLCTKYVLIKRKGKRKRSKVMNGFGFIDIMISVHYKSKHPSFVHYSYKKELLKLAKRAKRKIYLITEGSAIIYDGKKMNYFGDVYLFDKNKISKVSR